MRIVRTGLSQLDPATLTASVPEIPVPPGAGFTLTQYFLVAVAAGVTVYFVTRMLDRR